MIDCSACRYGVKLGLYCNWECGIEFNPLDADECAEFTPLNEHETPDSTNQEEK